MPTIEDVARHAGLSRTTVSRVINDQPYVCDEKRQRVVGAMRDLGYVPNSSARRLRSQKTETIAILLPRITNPFFSHMIEAMEKKASEWGYQVIICQTHYSSQKELDYLELIRTKQVDGMIMTSVHNEWSAIEEYLPSGPIVLCNENIEEANTSIIYIDQQEAAYDATTHLIEQGCQKLAFLSGGMDSSISLSRRRGFMKAVQKHNVSFVEHEDFNQAVDVESGRGIFQSIQQEDSDIDGIFTGSDEVAAGIIYEAMNKGISIPDDLAIVGFDNQTISKLMNPSITTIEQPVVEMAEKCVEILIQQIEQRGRHKREDYIFPHTLKKRSSTAKPMAIPM
ncbi:substrate-binding domain-containing protein [Pontibacillus yanchengensis]|uniref:Substrate-binding domain-containing protein n=2 Tax=Pontibacillus yanchengensis TaxID=462910 RepID=A0ACC7VFM8_9BACI|nr:LacI family DNA-binding transcriptional regulator [Pontibacillus yanchengensis]MYL32335.1 substrate-binding domain-containing protein [Pontibacillus yanchengensis]MYL52915.1 substrate-binding domain-containing protein [Pontibacillus yanchengensis]